MRIVRELLRNNCGAALIEFALILPFMVLLLFGGVEATQYVITNQKLEKAGYVLTDITTQFQEQSAVVPRPGELTQSDLVDDVFPQLARIMGNDTDLSKQVVILTSVRREGTAMRVKWQVAGGGTLTEDVVSQVNGLTPSAVGPGVRDTTASLPADVAAALSSVGDGENVVIGEVFMRYEPRISAIFPARTVSKSIYLHPRNNNVKLVCLPPNFVYDECIGGPSYAAVTCPSTNNCVGLDFVTRNCDGFVSGIVECAAACGATTTSACQGLDMVTLNCKGVEISRVVNSGACAVCSWDNLPFGPCTGACGGGAGVQQRGVHCYENGVYKPDDSCCLAQAGFTPENTIPCVNNEPCSAGGACGATYNTCVEGTPSNGVENTQCGGTSTWTCSGVNGGAPSSCSKANAACPEVSCSAFSAIDDYPLSGAPTNRVEAAILAANGNDITDPAYLVNRALRCFLSAEHNPLNPAYNPNPTPCPANTPYLSEVQAIFAASSSGRIGAEGLIENVYFFSGMSLDGGGTNLGGINGVGTPGLGLGGTPNLRVSRACGGVRSGPCPFYPEGYAPNTCFQQGSGWACLVGGTYESVECQVPSNSPPPPPPSGQCPYYPEGYGPGACQPQGNGWLCNDGSGGAVVECLLPSGRSLVWRNGRQPVTSADIANGFTMEQYCSTTIGPAQSEPANGDPCTNEGNVIWTGNFLEPSGARAGWCSAATCVRP